jgi:hypothetical protein
MGSATLPTFLEMFIAFCVTEEKVIGEPWFPGLTLKTVLN